MHECLRLPVKMANVALLERIQFIFFAINLQIYLKVKSNMMPMWLTLQIVGSMLIEEN